MDIHCVADGNSKSLVQDGSACMSMSLMRLCTGFCGLSYAHDPPTHRHYAGNQVRVSPNEFYQSIKGLSRNSIVIIFLQKRDYLDCSLNTAESVTKL